MIKLVLLYARLFALPFVNALIALPPAPRAGRFLSGFVMRGASPALPGRGRGGVEGGRGVGGVSRVVGTTRPTEGQCLFSG